ncbi:MAG: hypothetical protein A2521_03360 [Deltaproteobacteria bacterium RIFOXYD12_FULL_57_12]|nr:MAG: hypothetical protein A2521_03360 [Deltaproteobacteria bacterium RIFOXYD12_FULL_57_12]
MAAIGKSASILIKKPLTQVFNFVANPDNFHIWQPFAVEAKITSPGPMAAGSTYLYTFQTMGQRIETTGVITEFEPFRRYAYQSVSGPFPIRGGFLFQEVDGFVEVTAFGMAEPSGYFSMAGAVIGILLSRQINATLRTLKDILEGKG